MGISIGKILVSLLAAFAIVFFDFKGRKFCFWAIFITLMPNLNLQISVPTDGAAVSAYASVINKYAPHPYAAALAREYIFSDAGQINLARGYARPIRVDNIKLPEDVAASLLPSDMYTGTFTIKDNDAWSKTVAQMGQLWQEEVLAYLK